MTLVTASCGPLILSFGWANSSFQPLPLKHAWRLHVFDIGWWQSVWTTVSLLVHMHAPRTCQGLGSPWQTHVMTPSH